MFHMKHLKKEEKRLKNCENGQKSTAFVGFTGDFLLKLTKNGKTTWKFTKKAAFSL